MEVPDGGHVANKDTSDDYDHRQEDGRSATNEDHVGCGSKEDISNC
jgi:hypothetical protein